MSKELIDRERTGDETPFKEIFAPYQRERHVHCYRNLGSVADRSEERRLATEC